MTWGLLIGAVTGLVGIGIMFVALPRERRGDKIFGAWIGMIVAALVGAAVFGAISAANRDEPAASDRQAAFVTGFVDGCEANYAATGCRCVADLLLANYSLDDIERTLTTEGSVTGVATLLAPLHSQAEACLGARSGGPASGPPPAASNPTPWAWPTAIPRDAGCGAGASVSIEPPSLVGQQLHAGDAVAITISYHAPECVAAGVTVYGRKDAGEGYEYVALNTGTTGDVPLSSASGTLTLRPLPEHPSDLEGFEVCMVWVNLNDGLFGGYDFQHYEGTYCRDSSIDFPGGLPGPGGGGRYRSQ